MIKFEVPGKTCRKCEETKPVSEFHFRKDRGDYRHECKACRYEKSKQQPSRTPEKRSEYHAKWIERPGKRQKEHDRMTKWRQENAEYVNARAREWKRQNPDKVRQQWERRRAVFLEAFVEDVSLDYLFERDHGICQLCHKRVKRFEASTDHIVPLSKGGQHSKVNTQLAHLRCNKRKFVNAANEQMRLIG